MIKNLYLGKYDSQCEVLTWRDYGKGRLKYTAWNGNCICSTDLHFILISLFKYIPAIQNAFGKKKDEKKEETKAAVSETVEEVDETDDLELIAVISAAIAAAEETTTDGFVVRSIKRRPSNKWNS